MESVLGYFGLEKNLLGCTPPEMEERVGFAKDMLVNGARLLVLSRQSTLDEFVYAGTTRTSDAKGLVNLQLRQRATFIPGAWVGQRLIKVEAINPPFRVYPNAKHPIEQWELIKGVPGWELCRLGPNDKFWPR